MVKRKTKKRQHRGLLVVLALLVIAFDGGAAYLRFVYSPTLDRAVDTQNAKVALLEKQIEKIKADKIAAAKQTADANAALADQQAGKVVTPSGCAIDGHSAHQNPAAIDLLVNKKHCYNPIDYAPADLTTIDGATISAKIAPAFDALFQAAAAAGYPLSVTSSYRSYQDQVATYNGWVQTNGSTQAADTVSARPGYSEHQSGFAMDLAAGNCALECFLTSGQFTWMADHAADYGFIQRYPVGLTSITGYSDEAWHYRYVGKTVAADMKAKGIKTLEQYWGITGGDY